MNIQQHSLLTCQAAPLPVAFLQSLVCLTLANRLAGLGRAAVCLLCGFTGLHSHVSVTLRLLPRAECAATAQTRCSLTPHSLAVQSSSSGAHSNGQAAGATIITQTKNLPVAVHPGTGLSQVQQQDEHRHEDPGRNAEMQRPLQVCLANYCLSAPASHIHSCNWRHSRSYCGKSEHAGILACCKKPFTDRLAA